MLPWHAKLCINLAIFTNIFKEGSEVFSWEKRFLNSEWHTFEEKYFHRKYIEGRNVNKE